MRKSFVLLSLLLCTIGPAAAQVSIGIGMPGVSIGINLPVYPEFVRVPNYPVYYAPRVNSNYFFYDGMYWVYQQDNWYASSWYNGPWAVVAPDVVPVYILRVPVRYYRQPPAYFHGWRSDAPPRWDEHWGNSWQQNRQGWNNWNRNAAPPPAPLPSYQRQFSGNRYPGMEQQRTIQSQNYHYQPQDVVVQQHYQAQGLHAAPNAAPRSQAAPAAPEHGRQGSAQQERTQNAAPAQHAQPQQSAPSPQRQPQQQPQGAAQHEQKAPKAHEQKAPAAQREQPAPQDRGAAPAPNQDQGHDKGQGKGQDQGHDKGQGKGQDKGDQQGGERGK